MSSRDIRPVTSGSSGLPLTGSGEEIRRFQDAVRGRIERAAADTGRSVREIPPSTLLSLLCASGFGAVPGAAMGIAGAADGILGALVSEALDAMRARRHGGPPSREDLEREIIWRIERILAAGDRQASALRREIAMVLEASNAMGSALLAAIDSGNDQLRNDVIAAIDSLSSGFAEMAFLLRAGDRAAADVQRRLDGQGAEFRALSDMVSRQSADVRMIREDLAAIGQRQSLAGRAEVRDTGPGPRWTTGCPYRGLLPFDQAHAEVFCGRQRLTAELMVKLAGRLSGPAMLIVSGASGAGKSSLLQAGLLPALAAGMQLEGSDRWARVMMTPGADPLTELATRLAALSGRDAATVRRELAAAPGQAHLMVGQAIGASAATNGARHRADGQPGRLVLVVDQFEEVFTLNPGGDAGQQAFIAALSAAATRPSGPRGEPPALVVIAVRGDFWARCAAHPALARVMQDGLFVVGPMTQPELREAINGPAAAAGLQIDANLADIILTDLHAAGQEEAEGILPLLSQAMMLTWGRREGNRLTVRGYNETGGVARSVESGAEAVYEALPDAGQQIAREVFQALVLVSPDGQLARRTIPRADLCPERTGPARRAVDNVLEAFAGSRLLVLDGDTAQIAHDVLLRAWPRLRGWLESDQASWILYAQLQEDAGQWAEHGRDSSFLYRGSQLAGVEQAAARWTADPARYPALTEDQSGFLAASSRNAARGTRIRRAAVLTLALLLIASVAGVAVATQADRTANQQRNVAISNQLAAQSEKLDETNPVTAASLAAAAWKLDPTPEAQTALLDALAQPERGTVTAASGSITGLAFSADGKRVATATDTGAAQVWDMATHREIGKPLTIPEIQVAGVRAITFNQDGMAIAFHGGADGPSQFWNITKRSAIGSPFQIADNPMGGGIFSPDGKLVATGAVNGDLGLLDVATHHETGIPIPNADPLAFSPDGKLLAMTAQIGETAGDGVQLMEVATERMVGPVRRGPVNNTADAAFSPNGKVIAVTGPNSVTFWNVASGHAIGTPLPVAAGQIFYSPNGKFLATMSAAGTNLWDAATHQELGGTMAPDATSILGFSPDSTMLATADGATVSFWDLAVSRQIGAVIHGAETPVAFSPNGRVLASATTHGVGLWNVATHREMGAPLAADHPQTPEDMAFSPDGKILATGAGAPQLWNVATRGQLSGPSPGAQSGAGALGFTAKGKYLAFADGRKTWLWDMDASRIAGQATISGFAGAASELFSPDGSVLATVGQKGDEFATAIRQVRLFSTATHREMGGPLTLGVVPINGVAFSPDSKTIATASDTGVVIWDVATQRQAGTPLDVGVGPVQTVAFSPDGMILATGGQDGTIRLWDVASHEQIGSPLVVNNNAVDTIAFSPDGTLLAAANGTSTRLWGLDLTRNMVDRVCAVAGGSMSRQQWSSYVKSEPFQQTCPSA